MGKLWGALSEHHRDADSDECHRALALDPEKVAGGDGDCGCGGGRRVHPFLCRRRLRHTEPFHPRPGILARNLNGWYSRLFPASQGRRVPGPPAASPAPLNFVAPAGDAFRARPPAQPDRRAACHLSVSRLWGTSRPRGQTRRGDFESSVGSGHAAGLAGIHARRIAPGHPGAGEFMRPKRSSRTPQGRGRYPPRIKPTVRER